jgi:hypothetical protein
MATGYRRKRLTESLEVFLSVNNIKVTANSSRFTLYSSLKNATFALRKQQLNYKQASICDETIQTCG